MTELRKPSELDRLKAKRARLQARKATTRRTATETMAAWKEFGREVMARDGGVCRACGIVTRRYGSYSDPAEWGHVHHIVYRSAGGLDTLSNCVLLCGRCHQDEHDHTLSISGTAEALTTMRL